MKRLYLIAAMLSLLVLAISHSAPAEDQIMERRRSLAGGKYVPGEIIVKFKPGVNEEVIEKINTRLGTTRFYTSRFAGFDRVRIPAGKAISEMVELYKKDPNVDYAEPNYVAYALWMPDDPYYQLQWHMDNSQYGGINTEEAWQIETGNNSVIVAVVDTGVAYEDYTESSGRRRETIYYRAPDLAQTVFVPGYDFVNNDTHPNDDDGHGTHVSGTIAQSTNNGVGMAGVAFNCAIMPVKVLDNKGSGTYTDIADGIMFAADNGARVINLSLGGSAASITLENACAYAYNKGVAIVCASGNNGSPDTVLYPAAYDAYCIAVGATRYDETVTYYSNRGASLDLVAPGGDLDVDQNNDSYGDGVLQQTFGSAYNDWGYWFYEGTSMATPHVSGVAALLISNGVANTPAEVRDALQSTAEDHGPAGWDAEYGYGIVDAYAALQYSASPNNPPVANAQSVTTTEDTAVNITLTASDADGDSLSFIVVTNPACGTLSGTAPNLTYTPGAGFTGADSFTFKANDGTADSNVATVSITVNPTAPPEENFTFSGTVQAKGETPHPVTINSPGAQNMYVKLTWNDSSNDLRLRVYNPQGALVAERDQSTRQNRVEEITIDNLQAGVWQVAAKSDSKKSDVSYNIEGVVTY